MTTGQENRGVLRADWGKSAGSLRNVSRVVSSLSLGNGRLSLLRVLCPGFGQGRRQGLKGHKVERPRLRGRSKE